MCGGHLLIWLLMISDEFSEFVISSLGHLCPTGAQSVFRILLVWVLGLKVMCLSPSLGVCPQADAHKPMLPGGLFPHHNKVLGFVTAPASL